MSKTISLASSVIFSFLFTFLGTPSLWAVDLDYSTLQMNDLSQMNKEVQRLLAEAKQYNNDDDEENAVSSLTEATVLIFSRPDSDNIISVLFRDVRPRLKDLGAFISVLNAITKKAINDIRDDQVKTKYRATKVILLENLMAELKPDLDKNEKIKELFAFIRDAEIKIPKDVRQHFLLKGMSSGKVSPSELAEKIIGKSKGKKKKKWLFF